MLLLVLGPECSNVSNWWHLGIKCSMRQQTLTAIKEKSAKRSLSIMHSLKQGGLSKTQEIALYTSTKLSFTLQPRIYPFFLSRCLNRERRRAICTTDCIAIGAISSKPCKSCLDLTTSLGSPRTNHHLAVQMKCGTYPIHDFADHAIPLSSAVGSSPSLIFGQSNCVTERQPDKLLRSM